MVFFTRENGQASKNSSRVNSSAKCQFGSLQPYRKTNLSHVYEIPPSSPFLAIQISHQHCTDDVGTESPPPPPCSSSLRAGHGRPLRQGILARPPAVAVAAFRGGGKSLNQRGRALGPAGTARAPTRSGFICSECLRQIFQYRGRLGLGLGRVPSNNMIPIFLTGGMRRCRAKGAGAGKPRE